MFLSLDGTFFVQLLNFAIFFAILSVVFIRPVGRAIVARRAYINSVTADYERYQTEAAQMRAQAEAVRAAARREAEQALAKARALASNESARLSAEYAERAAHTVRAAHETVAAELQTARSNEGRQAGELADLIVRKAIPELSG